MPIIVKLRSGADNVTAWSGYDSFFFQPMLSDSEGSDVEPLHELNINEHYAKAFEYKKEREELQKRVLGPRQYQSRR